MRYKIPFELLTEENKQQIAAEYDIEVSELEVRNYEIESSIEDLTGEQTEYLVSVDTLWICDDCGRIYDTRTSQPCLVYDGDNGCEKSVCNDCSYNYYQCEETGHYFRSDDTVTINPGTSREAIVYARCDRADEAYRCECCGGLFDECYINSDNYNDFYVCDNCFDNRYYGCAHCGMIVHEDDAYPHNGCHYCEDCYNGLAFGDDDDDDDDDGYDENYDFKYIDGYHHDNRQDRLIFRRMPNENDAITEYLGVELEVEAKDEPLRRELDERAHAIKDVVPFFFMIKYDGSLNRDYENGYNRMDGFEMVTDPCSLRFHLEKFPWEQICDTAIANNMLSDKARNCGLHIHVSREALGNNEEEQDMTAAKLIILFERFENEIECFARRRSTRWANFYKFKAKKENFNDVSKEMHDELCNKSGDTHSPERYHAINLTNTHTIEFRVFKGSLNIETIKASIEFVHEIVEFAKASNLIKVQNCVWTDIVHNTEYAELKSYLKRRNIYWHGCGDNVTINSDNSER